MEKYEKIIARLEAAKDAYDAVHLAARRAGEPEQGNPAYNEVGEEYCRAWDAAGEIWNAACDAEADGKRAKARELWSLLAPYDDEAATRLAAL
jgi:hypothetical protein